MVDELTPNERELFLKVYHGHDEGARFTLWLIEKGYLKEIKGDTSKVDDAFVLYFQTEKSLSALKEFCRKEGITDKSLNYKPGDLIYCAKMTPDSFPKVTGVWHELPGKILEHPIEHVPLSYGNDIRFYNSLKAEESEKYLIEYVKSRLMH